MINSDTLRERIRERLEEGEDIYADYCDSCKAQLTDADWEAEACTNCGAALFDDESVNEDLWEVADYADMERNDCDY